MRQSDKHQRQVKNYEHPNKYIIPLSLSGSLKKMTSKFQKNKTRLRKRTYGFLTENVKPQFTTQLFKWCLH